MAIRLEWTKCGEGGGHWCDLFDLDLDGIGNVTGVYVIWVGGGPVIYVGQGQIESRLRQHRVNPDFLKYVEGPDDTRLFVTWAVTSEGATRNVERYLAEALRPLRGDRYPSVAPMEVDLPWPWSRSEA